MILHDEYDTESFVHPAGATHYSRDGQKKAAGNTLLSEHHLAIHINESLTYRLVCTREHLAELVLGRLCTDRVIRSTADVSYLSLCRHGLTADVYLEKKRQSRPFFSKEDSPPAHGHSSQRDSVFLEETQTCCTDNHVLNRDFVQPDSPLPEILPLNWQPDWVFSCAEMFLQDTPLHIQTRSTHSCFLCRDGEILFTAEDIGRHNAMDKAIGHALLNDVPLSACYLFTSGRVPTDMMRKVLYAGIPLLISKELPTTDAVELAAAHGVTLIGKARPESFLRFT